MENDTKITTNKELLNDLLGVYSALRNGEMAQGMAKQLANVAGKAVSSGKAQLEYNKWVKNEGKIDFFE